jgi:muramoyltetrapeptide carboxypeptidase
MSDSFFIKPPRLEPGDTIGAVAPAWPCSETTLRDGISRLETLGFKVKYSPAIFDRYLFLAGEDSARAEQINKMFEDKTVKAVFCATAGYGSIRLLSHLDKNVIQGNPKVFIGYSDITVLLVYLLEAAHMVAFHGPILGGDIHEKTNSSTLEYLLRTIMDSAPPPPFHFNSMKALRPGRGRGILIGGNLSLLTRSLGTPYEINTRNRILFLEDNCYDVEDLDCHLTHLKLAGKLGHVRGIVFGELLSPGAKRNDYRFLNAVVTDALGDLKVPVVSGFPAGHGSPQGVNVTLPFGIMAELDADKPHLALQESGVA